MTKVNILEGLNPAQWEAVNQRDGSLLIIAGPGSGKTKVIVHRIAHLIRTFGISPHSICSVTFTNKAAKELRDRLTSLLGPTQSNDVTAGTFHSICARILRSEAGYIGLSRNFTIYDREDQVATIKECLNRVNLDPGHFNPRIVLSRISQAKAKLIDAETFNSVLPEEYWDEIISRVYPVYQEMLRKFQALDFDDLLLKVYQLFQGNPDVLYRYQSRYLHVLVDEFQDTNIAQYTIARMLAEGSGNFCVVGDPDQAIYGWRNADIRNILMFKEDFPSARVIVLEQNYRSTPKILSAAQGVISSNVQRLEKRLVPTRAEGSPVIIQETIDADAEASWVVSEIQRLCSQDCFTYKDFMIGYRVNAQSRPFEHAFRQQNIPILLVGALAFYQRREIKDILAYLRVLVNPSDDVSFMRILNVPARGIGKQTRDNLIKHSRNLNCSLSSGLDDMFLESLNIDVPSPSGRPALKRFHGLLSELHSDSARLDVRSMIQSIIERSNYMEFIQNQENFVDKEENLLELLNLAGKFDEENEAGNILAFLEQTSLVSDTDNLSDVEDGVTLITLHQAKGLEFPVVFMVGMEEGRLPHARSIDSGDDSQMEEERRLCYVGMTRAEDRLYLTRSVERLRGGYPRFPNFNGEEYYVRPSQFLADIPKEFTSLHKTKRLERIKNSPSTTSENGLIKEKSRHSGDIPFLDGERVNHPMFGVGTVVSCKISADDFEITVAFKAKEYGLKRLLHSYARLVRIG